jgi:cytochrome subunit of sulfide dehydrogenase
MSRRWKGWTLAVGAMAVSMSALAAPPSAAMLGNACAGCHGTNGASAGLTMPSLAGQTRESIVFSMKKFKSGERQSTIMGQLARGYSEAEIDALADFFSAQKAPFSDQVLDPDKVAKGASLQENNCSGCHIENGKAGKNNAISVAGQWLPYLQIQMNLYLTEQRKMPGKMAQKVNPLSKEDLDALMHFYASVK